MKTYPFLALLLLGVLLTWPACDPATGDPSEPDDCGYTIPNVTYSVNCEPDPVYLRGLDIEQLQRRPDLPDPVLPANPVNRVVRLTAPPADGDFYLHLYVGIPATVYVTVFAGSCGEELVEIFRDDQGSEAVAISHFISTGGESFPDVYVRIEYELFRRDLYADYLIDPRADIAVAVYDEVRQAEQIDYNANDTGPSFLTVNCDGTAFERLVVTACNPEADVLGYTRELGLRRTEESQTPGLNAYALEVPRGMSLNFLSSTDPPPGGGGGPYTPVRRPKKDSTEFIVEPDYVITLPTGKDNEFILLRECPGQNTFPLRIGDGDNGDDCFNPSGEEVACLAWQQFGGADGPGARRLRVAMIDSGADADGGLSSVWPKYGYYGEETSVYLTRDAIGYDFIRGDDDPEDEVGHGTTTAATLIGNYRNESYPLTVYHMKVFGRDDVASYFGAVVAINAAIDADFDLVNMSWGLPLDEPPFALSCAVQRARGEEVILVASAGNENVDLAAFPQWPASYSRPALEGPHVMTVGSMAYPNHDVTNEPRKVFYSNFGAVEVDVAAYLTFATPAWRGPIDQSVYVAGTSVSAPLAAGRLCRFIDPGTSGGLAALGRFYNEAVRQSAGLRGPGHVVAGRYVPLCE